MVNFEFYRQFTDLMSYLHTFENINDLSSPDKITTFFVPNDNAMQKIPMTQLNRLRNDPMELQRVGLITKNKMKWLISQTLKLIAVDS